MVSYLISDTHNQFTRRSQAYTHIEIIDQVSVETGAIVGVLLTGLIADYALRRKRFLMVFIMNFMLLLWDIYLFVSVGSTSTELSKNTFSIILGAILAGNNLIYLILIPMMIAKVAQERIAQEGQRSCVAGTLVGTMLAVSLVGRFLISQNIATLLAYLTR